MLSRLPRLTLGHLWVVAALAVVVADTLASPVEPDDFWHYLEAGRYMVQSGALLDADRYSFTAPGRPFVNLHWGSQVLFYLGYRLGGIPLLVVLHAVSTGAAFALVFMTAHRRAASLRLAAVATILAFVVGWPCLTLRPQAFSVLLFALTVFLVERDRMWALPAVFVIWANLHAAFPLGLLVVGVRALVARKGRPDTAWLVAFVASAAATLVTPWGIYLYTAVFAAEPASRAALIDEWQPLDVAGIPGAVFFTALIGLLLVRARVRTAWRPGEAVVLAALTYLVLREQRAMVWWALAIAPAAGATLAASARCSDGPVGRVILDDERHRAGDRVGLNWLFVAALCAHVVCSTPWVKGAYPLIPPARRALLAPDTPVAMAQTLADRPGPLRIYAEMTWAGYFSWALGDRCRVFYDARVVVFPRSVMADYTLVTIAHADWQRLLDRYGTDTLALRKSSQPLLVEAARASPCWTATFEDEEGVVFRRTGPQGADRSGFACAPDAAR